MTGSIKPAGWATVRLDEIAEVRLGRQRSPKNHTGEQMRRYLRAANVTWSGVDTADVKEMNFTDHEVETYRLRDGDLLLSEASGSAKEVGKPGIWRSQLEGDVCFQNTLIRVRPEDGIESDFLYFRFLYEALRGGFVETSRGVGIHHLGAAKLASLQLLLPPTDQQRRIAEALSEQLRDISRVSDDLLALRKKTERLADAVLNKVVREATAAVSKLTPAGDVCQISGGIQKQPKRHPTPDDPGVPFLRVANVGRRTLRLSDVHRIRITDVEQDRVLLESGDLLVVEGNGSAEQIGRAALWRGAITPCTHQNHLIRVRADGALLPEFLELVWNAPTTANVLMGVASTTSGLYTLSTKKVAAVPLPVPDLTTQARLVAQARAQLELSEQTLVDVERIANPVVAMRLTTLRAAFSGGIGAADPSEEPVEITLKRIADEREARAKRGTNRTASMARTGRTSKTQEHAK